MKRVVMVAAFLAATMLVGLLPGESQARCRKGHGSSCCATACAQPACAQPVCCAPAPAPVCTPCAAPACASACDTGCGHKKHHRTRRSRGHSCGC